MPDTGLSGCEDENLGLGDHYEHLGHWILFPYMVALGFL